MNTVDKPAEDFTRSWRYKVGLGLIIIGHVIMALGLLSPMLGVSASMAGGMVVGGELVGLASIAFLGKEGFKAIKAKAFAFLKADFTAHVDRTRHRIGVVLLCISAMTTYILMAFALTGFAATTVENPLPAVWGLDYDQQASLVLWLFLAGDICFLIAIWTLGADWWGRFRDLFIWKKPDEQLESAD